MHRVFVEKRAEFANEARRLLRELQESLELRHLNGLRLVQRYDLEGLEDAEFDLAVANVLSEPQTDVALRELAIPDGTRAFAVEYLPGQFDQRADSAAQCLQILTGKERPVVASARVILLEGSISEAELDAIKRYVINAVDSHEASMALPDTLDHPTPPPPDVELLEGFGERDPATVRADLGLAMSAEDVAFCQKYFSGEEQRDPSITEIRMLDTYWSDHCRHTTFLTRIEDVTFDEGTEPIQRAWKTYLDVRGKLGREEKPVTLMDIALAGMRELRASGELDNLEESEEINAASIIVPVEISPTPGSTLSAPRSEEWLIQFKNETHNHPTEIEPFGGAATCLGGCIRDPLSGRSYVYQAMRVTGAANPLAPFSETLPGKLPQRKICQIAAEGYASYGNQIGLATGQVAEVYHPGYLAKRMEIGAVVAAAPRENVFRGSPSAGDLILLIGGRTGRDGVGGATGSSKEHDDSALENSAEVQKGDAPTERKIQRLFRNADLARRIKICNDFGAGGVSVAIGEIAPSLDIELDAVTKKYDGLDGTELAISESQERMAVCVDPADLDFFVAASDAENLECTHVATVADHGRLRMTWRGKTIVDLSRAFLDTNGVQQSATIHVNSPTPPKDNDHCSPITDHLAQLNHCSQKGLGEMFDGSVGAGTVLWPFGGERQLTPPDAMVAKLPLLEGDTDTCSYMSWAYDPYRSSDSPFHGSAWAVTESALKCVAAGARLSDIRLTLQEYFPKLGDDPSRWGLPFAALLGAFDAQHGLRLAAIGGKDSMSGSFNELDVPPTLVSFALAPGQASLALSPEFKEAGSTVSLVEVPPTEEGLPDYPAILALATQLHGLNKSGGILSMKHVGSPGLAHALAVCCFGNHLGFQRTADLRIGTPPMPAAFLIEHSEPLHPSLGAVEIGSVTDEPILELGHQSHSLDDLLKAWTGTLEPVYPTRPEETPVSSVPADLPIASPPSPLRAPRSPLPAPKVVIPAFPGTNSEYDSAKAFREAGAESEILVFRNLTAAHLDESLAALAAKIRESQILFLPGGFSSGDEPDGSAKFITAVLRSPRVAEAVMDLLQNRDGLILGICNGFQALIKTGLVPYGEIREPDPASPTLFHNDIGRHVSCYARTRIASTLSPWFAGCREGDLHRVPVSHGEGKFIADAETLQQLAAAGQIATQYCDADGRPSMDIAHNPNGSHAAVEGLTSPCGRVLGKMGHTERRGTHVAKNIPGNKHQPLFKAGVRWFS
ncbi:phosphoribosylformylglycinamidine synthase [Haloferula sp. A504]|uniref:phosphoribosylformylglycinamidine synthase n=1 Tax=Haloferula sp. A504 TaxID=3373601 RepID=UPI0031CB82EA|nr:phosphoribosylformylglycinamidine synthase [Verrucomicrobiaceae bacterium E54]